MAGAEDQLADPHDDAGDRQIADLPGVWRGRRPDIVGRQRHAEEVAGDHDQDHQQRRQDCMAGHEQADRQKQHLDGFLGDGVQRVAQDALEGNSPFLDRGDDAGEPGSVSTMPAADLATSVAVETAIPIWAWRNAGASLAPSPHMPTV